MLYLKNPIVAVSGLYSDRDIDEIDDNCTKNCDSQLMMMLRVNLLLILQRVQPIFDYCHLWIVLAT